MNAKIIKYIGLSILLIGLLVFIIPTIYSFIICRDNNCGYAGLAMVAYWGVSLVILLLSALILLSYKFKVSENKIARRIVNILLILFILIVIIILIYQTYQNLGLSYTTLKW